MFYNIVSVGYIYMFNMLVEIQGVYHPICFQIVPLKYYSNLYNYSNFDQVYTKNINENGL